MCSSQTPELENPRQPLSPHLGTSNTHPRASNRIRQDSAAQGLEKAAFIAKSAPPPWPGKVPQSEVVLQEIDGEVQNLVHEVLTQPHVVRMTITPKSNNLFERVQMTPATT